MKILIMYLFISLITFIIITNLANRDDEIKVEEFSTFIAVVICSLLWLPILIYAIIKEVFYG